MYFFLSKLSSKCSSFRFRTFQNEIKFKMFHFDTFKGFLILTELGNLGKFGRKIKQIRKIYLNCQLSLSFKKTQLLCSHSWCKIHNIKKKVYNMWLNPGNRQMPFSYEARADIESLRSFPLFKSPTEGISQHL